MARKLGVAKRAYLMPLAWGMSIRGMSAPDIAEQLLAQEGKALNLKALSEKTVDSLLKEARETLMGSSLESLEEILLTFREEQRAVMLDAWNRLQNLPADAPVSGIQSNILQASLNIAKGHHVFDALDKLRDKEQIETFINTVMDKIGEASPEVRDSIRDTLRRNQPLLRASQSPLG